MRAEWKENEYFALATFNPLGDLLAEESKTHDRSGNEIQRGDKKLYFDAFQRLVRVERTSDGAVLQVNKYDCLGRRTSKTFLPPGGTPGTDEQTRFFVCDGAREIEELDGAGNLVADYVWGGLYVDQICQARVDRGSGLEEVYYHSDSLFSTAALTNASGAVVERYEYSSIYGAHDVTDGSGGAVGSVGQFANPWRFQGRRFDAETGLLYFRQRYLDPAQGRFVSRDPLGLWGDPGNLGNPYAFCGNDPVNRVDPWGLQGEEAVEWPEGAETPDPAHTLNLLQLPKVSGERIAFEAMPFPDAYPPGSPRMYYRVWHFSPGAAEGDPGAWKLVEGHASALLTDAFDDYALMWYSVLSLEDFLAEYWDFYEIGKPVGYEKDVLEWGPVVPILLADMFFPFFGLKAPRAAARATSVGKLIIPKGVKLLRKEREAVEALVKRGYDVEVLKPSKTKGVRTPDLYIRQLGKVDLYKPSVMDSTTIVRAIEKKFTQSEGIYVQLTNYMHRSQMQTIANRAWGKAKRNLARGKTVKTNLLIFELKGKEYMFRRPCFR